MVERHAIDCGGQIGTAEPTVTVVKKGVITAVVFHPVSEDRIQIGQEVTFKGVVSRRF